MDWDQYHKAEDEGSQSLTSANVTIPHKAEPKQPGKVFRFHGHQSVEGNYEEDFWVEHYIDFIAHELTHTDIGVIEGGYSSPPSVLVFTHATHGFNVANRNSQADGYSVDSLRSSIGSSNKEVIKKVYGVSKDKENTRSKEEQVPALTKKESLFQEKLFKNERMKEELTYDYESLENKLKRTHSKLMKIWEHSNEENSSDGFKRGRYTPVVSDKMDYSNYSEKKFLQRITIDAGTGINYYAALPANNDEQIRLHIESARKFFDIVLIAPVVPAPIPGYLITKNYTIDFNPVIESSKWKNVLVRDRISTAIVERQYSHENNSSDDPLFMIAPPERNADLMERQVIHALSLDFTRDILGVRNRGSVLDSVPKQRKKSKRTALVPYRGKPYPNAIATLPQKDIFGKIVLGALGATTLTTVSVFTGDVVAVTAAFAALASGSYSFFISSQDSRNSSVRKWAARHGKEQDNELGKIAVKSAGFYNRIPVGEAPISQAYEHRKLVSPKVEFLEVEGRTNATPSLPSRTQDSTGYGMSFSSINSRIEDLKGRWMEYELNPLMALDFPLMLDPSCKQTGDFIRAMRLLDMRQEQVEEDKSSTSTGPLWEALAAAEDAFLVAEAHAKKTRLSQLATDERKKVKKARSLANVMLDESASPNERKLAYEQANKALEGVLQPLSPKVVGLIDS